jgi:hypothetical protein
MKSFFSQVFTPLRKPKVRIEYQGNVFVLVDDADQNLGFEFRNFNDAFRFAKTAGYEFSDNDYFI